jgi:hypothetical protein
MVAFSVVAVKAVLALAQGLVDKSLAPVYSTAQV